MAEKRPALGRGLSALIPISQPAMRETPTEVDLDLLGPNPYQPRLAFDEERLEELAQSIRANGVIQPVLVRRRDGRFEIIAGERRWRAAQRAGLLKIPVVVRDVPDDKLLQVALIENIQRENLNPIDEAQAYRRLMDEFQLTQEALAAGVGKDRSTVANFLRLLKLPEQVRVQVASGALSMGHARAILGLEREEDQVSTAKEVVARGFSVRDTELLVKRVTDRLAEPHAPPKAPAAPAPVDVHTRQAEDRLKLSLGTRVRIKRKGKGGVIEIEFVNEDELHRLYEQLT
ncbi:MAG: ParB/RepB/Spo0J family partition protein [Vicinamibacterales bacterium]|nr:ParB/RepB/Spo0J family partition protein [Vicinamibacterales bacterium]